MLAIQECTKNLLKAVKIIFLMNEIKVLSFGMIGKQIWYARAPILSSNTHDYHYWAVTNTVFTSGSFVIRDPG